MPIFISYSHSDGKFATRLANQLVKHKASVWIDQWELQVGDSLINRVQEAIQGASGLLVILSKASVESEWCKKELSTGLIRELEERRVVVLPILMEDCTIPLFLKDKLFADFRTNFDDGLRAILESISRVTSDSLLRIDSPEWHVDWAVDWGMYEDTFIMTLTAVEQAVDQPYCVLTEVRIGANAVASERYVALLEADLDWVERAAIIDLVCETAEHTDLRLRLEDELTKTASMIVNDTKTEATFCVDVRSRRLGQDTGRDVLIDVGGQLRALREGQREIHRRLTPDERKRLRNIQSRFERCGPHP
jgi:hypothetical protein